MARSLFNRKKQNTQASQNKQQPQAAAGKNITKNLDSNLEEIKKLLGNPSDLVTRELMIGGLETRAAIIYINGLTDKDLINDNILKTIQLNMKQFESNVLEKIYQEVIAITDIKKSTTMDEVSSAILNGSTAFYLDEMDTVLLMGTSGGETRSIEEPSTESLIRGPKDGFVESIETNIALIRRDIRDPNLRFKQHEVGKRSKQKLVVSYVEGIVNQEIVDEIDRRLKTIDVDIVADSAYVEQWIEDSFLSIFPQIANTERPDRVSTALTQGKVAILVEGTPFVLLAPTALSETLQSMEDYNQRWVAATLQRTLRYFSAFIAVFLPGLYIALVSYHPGMIPSTLVFSIAASREGVPFPAAVEAVLMAATFEILHEAGIRLPKVIGQTVGIVGGLVIGEAAVSAGIVSPIMVIVTALTAIATFSVPSYSIAITFRILRFSLMIAAALLGLYGIIIVYIMVNIHLVNMKSIGVPYTAPFAPSFVSDWRDLIIRAPITKLIQRPIYLKPTDEQSKDTKPE
ncbi:spore germination protein [Oceanobacillus saliphilus]|uniref:spore germination protein n=1 Tax=Oceanobacillus saliphilus TaxID=2925834 RepID=UPI00201E3155|nr:spore germination protein [Oceanobacillus saliphilus]